MCINGSNNLTPMRLQDMITNGSSRELPDSRGTTTGNSSHPHQENQTRQSRSTSTVSERPKSQLAKYLDSLKPHFKSNSSLIERGNTMICIDDLENTVIIYDRDSKLSLQPPRRDSISSQLWQIEESDVGVDKGIHRQNSSVQLERPVLSRQSQTVLVEFEQAVQELQLQLQQQQPPQKPNEERSAPTTPESSPPPPPLQRSHGIRRETNSDPVHDGGQRLESDSDKSYMSVSKPLDPELERPTRTGPRPGFLQRIVTRLFGCGGVPQKG